eukprot:TRINITY_DN51450_c0_g1_i1.p1 TRINITY_DN51450_c0_g1~~TRINITY_DN51450_c0_g1_i1.p1  ORF type:complete len:486 (+),score=99.54 TRINITY_DN51450_c0_g1_i1:29-1486(+)
MEAAPWVAVQVPATRQADALPALHLCRRPASKNIGPDGRIRWAIASCAAAVSGITGTGRSGRLLGTGLRKAWPRTSSQVACRSAVSTASEWSNLKVYELKAVLRERGLPLDGSKADLLVRLEQCKPEEPRSSAGKPASSDEFKPRCGELALAKADDKRYYTVNIVRDNNDGTFGIQWVEDGSEDSVALADLRPQPKKLRAGDFVCAKCQADREWYTAEVKKDAGAGKLTVAWLWDNSEEDVLLDEMFPQRKRFMVGQRVTAKHPDDGMWYASSIAKDLGDHRYEVEWDDAGESCTHSQLIVDDIRHGTEILEMSKIEVGQKLTGIVNYVTSYGAFLSMHDSPHLSGMIHVSRMARTHVECPLDCVQAGDEVTAYVLDTDKRTNRVQLSLTPVQKASELSVGQKLKGIVCQLKPFGAFVDIGVEQRALLHVTRMVEDAPGEYKDADGNYLLHPEDYVQVGQTVDVWLREYKDGKSSLTMHPTPEMT